MPSKTARFTVARSEMSPPVIRIPVDEGLPQAADVVVIGAGVIGVSAAYHLARQGHKVALLEKGHVAAEQSSRNWGWCRQQTRPQVELALIRESLGLWEEMQKDSGRDVGFRRAGVLSLTKDSKEAADWEQWAAIAREEQIHSSMLTPSQIMERLPANTERWVAGIYTSSDGLAEPSMAAPAFALRAREYGATIHENCAVRGVEMAAGAVNAVITEKGRIRASTVILAGGAWSSLFCRRHGIKLPIGLVDATACATTPAGEITDGALGTGNYCIRRRQDRGLTLAVRGRGTVYLTPELLRDARLFWPTFMKRRKGLKLRLPQGFVSQIFRAPDWSFDSPSPFEAMRIRDPAPDMGLVESALRALIRGNPQLGGIQIATAWGGTIDSTPDTLPVISGVQSFPGFYLATGFSGAGFGTGPAAGRLIADIVLGKTPIVDPCPYSYQRFTDGRPLAPISPFTAGRPDASRSGS